MAMTKDLEQDLEAYFRARVAELDPAVRTKLGLDDEAGFRRLMCGAVQILESIHEAIRSTPPVPRDVLEAIGKRRPLWG
jgi:hypothetical protein